jgi:hypothetical protein
MNLYLNTMKYDCVLTCFCIIYVVQINLQKYTSLIEEFCVISYQQSQGDMQKHKELLKAVASKLGYTAPSGVELTRGRWRWAPPRALFAYLQLK